MLRRDLLSLGFQRHDWCRSSAAAALLEVPPAKRIRASICYRLRRGTSFTGSLRRSSPYGGVINNSSSSSMEEQQVGIEEYITSTSGFTGILKHRYNDFQVYEVDLSGRTARLTCTDAPVQEQTTATRRDLTSETIEEVTAAFAAIAGVENANRLQQLLCNILTQQTAQQQGSVPAQVPEKTSASEGQMQALPPAAEVPVQQQQQQQQQQLDMEVDLLPVEDKEIRKAIHQFLKSDPRLPPLQTDTVAGESATEDQQPVHNIIRVRRAAKGGNQGGGRQKGQQGGRKGGKRAWRDDPDWEGGANKHLRFVMLKENMETQAALTIISRMLHCHMKNFGFAGTKDKRGITTQFVTVWKTPAAKLAALNPRLRGIKLGNFDYVATHLQLGQLKGNKFRILMRDVSSNDEQHISSAVNQVRERGFINYFGLQRFGTGSVPTHRVGGALLRGEWQGAVQLIMQGGSGERQEFREARELYTEKGDIKGALAALPTFLVAERAVLQALAKSGPNSYLSALQAIPRTLRSMYMHAWQSWVWNRAASERVRKYGADRVAAGDLVLLQSDMQQAGVVECSSEAADPEQLLSAEAADDLDAAVGASAASRLAAVHVVTAEEADEGKYSIQDVVLPLPGGRVQYPKHEAGWELYGRLAAADGVMIPGMSQDEFAAAAAVTQTGNGEVGQESTTAPTPAGHGVRDFQLAELTGDYRKLLHIPADLTHEVVKYSNPDQDDLLQSDWSQLQDAQGRQQKRQKKGTEQLQEAQKEDNSAFERSDPAANGSKEVDADARESTAGTLLGVVLDFTLPPSCYATMLIRELTKSSTSKAAHKELSCRG